MHFVTRETGYTQHPPRQGNKGMGIRFSPPAIVPSKIVNVPLQSTKRYAGVNEGGARDREKKKKKRESIYYLRVESSKTCDEYVICTHI